MQFNTNTVTKKWYALSCKARSEKWVLQKLISQKFEAELPLLNQTKIYSKKIRTTQIPLLTGYVFVKCQPSDEITFCQFPNVGRLVRSHNKIAEILYTEIEALHFICGKITNSKVKQSKLNIGDEVIISKGTLFGTKGVVFTQVGKHNYIVQLTNIGVHLEIEIPENQLELISK